MHEKISKFYRFKIDDLELTLKKWRRALLIN
jgi:hypothetical protein